jgi:hypothetical protein
MGSSINRAVEIILGQLEGSANQVLFIEQNIVNIISQIMIKFLVFSYHHRNYLLVSINENYLALV